MKMRMVMAAAFVAALVGFAGESYAAGTAGYAGVNLNVRSGPSTRFPKVGVLGAGSELTIHGCVARYTWCDVSASGVRGWASGALIQFVREQRRVYVPAYAETVGIPVITFNINTYWDDYYRDYDFYRERDRWDDVHWSDDIPPGWREDWEIEYTTPED